MDLVSPVLNAAWARSQDALHSDRDEKDFSIVITLVSDHKRCNDFVNNVINPEGLTELDAQKRQHFLSPA